MRRHGPVSDMKTIEELKRSKLSQLLLEKIFSDASKLVCLPCVLNKK